MVEHSRQTGISGKAVLTVDSWYLASDANVETFCIFLGFHVLLWNIEKVYCFNVIDSPFG